MTNEANASSSSSSKPARQPSSRVAKPAAPPPPGDGCCNFYIRKKNRYCRMSPAKGLRFCGEHVMSERGEDLPEKKIRIPCPVDPTHTCYKTQLQKHLRICNARLEDMPVGFVRNINAGPMDLEIPSKITINDLQPLELKAFVEKVLRLSEDFCLDGVEIQRKEHPVMKTELEREDLSEDGALKHARQQSSILAHMASGGLLGDDYCYVEMGAGRGHVNHWIQRALGPETGARFVLVDRQGVRYKMDAFHRNDSEGPKFHRLRMDIEHLNLSVVPEVACSRLPVVLVSKHLCGAATDLSLRCALDCRSDAADSVAGVVVALCCHHRVEYRSYVGLDFLSRIGFDPREFWLLRSLSSWATCGFERGGKEEEREEEEEREKNDPSSSSFHVDRISIGSEKKNDSGSNRDFDSDWGWYYRTTAEERSRIGRRCKRLLDRGRLEYLVDSWPGVDVKLVPYVDEATSLENVLLMAVGKS